MLSVKKKLDETLRQVKSYNAKPAHTSSNISTQFSNSTDQDYTSRKSSTVSQDSSFGCDNDMDSRENTRKISATSSTPSSCSS